MSSVSLQRLSQSIRVEKLLGMLRVWVRLYPTGTEPARVRTAEPGPPSDPNQQTLHND